MAGRLEEKNEFEIELTKAILDSSRKKLELWGILPVQVKELEKRGSVSDHMTIYAPVGGTVVKKFAFEGKYVKEGERLYTIADLSQVWVFLDAYELDMDWIHYGQTVEITAEAYPGEVFKGRISFIEPFLDEMTRTVKVRVNVPNPDEKLKPGMFVRAIVHSRATASGKLYEPDLAGKWICRMHPEIIREEPGTCDICGMELVTSEEFGFLALAPKDDPEEKPMVVPASAVLLTGKRAVVYVEEDRDGKKAYIGREIVVGPRAGDYYIVKSGLKEGEKVVVRGNFKIDASLQILAKPSMMLRREERAEGKLKLDKAHYSQLSMVLKEYLKLQSALAEDSAEDAIESLQKLKAHTKHISAEGLQGEVKQEFEECLGEVREALVPEAKELGELRKLFATLSEAFVDFVEKFGHKEPEALREVFCPMALGEKRAFWLQSGEKVKNPYFGKEMQECGEIKKVIEPTD